jgi:hypothetical protein
LLLSALGSRKGAKDAKIFLCLRFIHFVMTSGSAHK